LSAPLAGATTNSNLLYVLNLQYAVMAVIVLRDSLCTLKDYKFELNTS